MLDFQYTDFASIMNEVPDKQLPDSYPSTSNPTITPPMNPTPDVAGPDAPEVAPGSRVARPEQDEEDVAAGDAEPA